MRRKARIEAAGALHDLIVPGIEREEIFKDDEERNSFIDRLGQIALDTRTDDATSILPASASGKIIRVRPT